MTTKTVVAVLFGGRSSEHSISCATARGVLQAINPDRYDVIPIGITPEGAFTLASANPDDYILRPGQLPVVEDNGTRIMWPESAQDTTLWVHKDGHKEPLGKIDVVFPILHGPWGEDGTIQGMLELYDFAYVGSGVLASSLGMDKHYTKTVLHAAGIPVAPWITARRYEWKTQPEKVTADATAMGLPVFVKPARAGSSVGVSKVTSWEDFPHAMNTACMEDDHVLIEKAMIGREIECAVLQSMPGQPTRASVAGEIIISGREFYDFEAKYLGAEGIELVCPAALSDDELATLQHLSIQAFEAINGAGLARVDFFLTDYGFVLNEINTMPGFTPISMFPRCWEESGMSYSELIDDLIAVALAHHRED